jgi:hypothetical protein
VKDDYREAVTKRSPGLSRFATTLGNGSSDNNPTGVAAVCDLDQLHKSPLDFDSFRFARETQSRWGLHPC